MTPPLVLASASPRRRQLLAMLGVRFTIIVGDVPESLPEHGDPVETARALALGKAEAVARAHPSALILAADTIVVLDGMLLGKPLDAPDAVRLLRALRGRWHQVITGVAVIDGGRGRIAIGHEQTHVLMRAYSDEEIAAYVASGDPMDKAAAYGIQHPTFNPVETIATCYTNVMGLPLCLVADLLALFGGGLERPLDLRTPQCPWCIQARAMNGPPGRGSGA